ncbi:MAG: M48 family metallopeptidase [Sedimentisphaerales bacterium]|jgi:predicted Zn-dependent protease|nr:M48 family metallopeptidase [Sedimentisphaerales bacterium]
MIKSLKAQWFIFCWLSLLAGCAVNPLTGREQPMFISEQEEFALGDRMAPQVERQLQGAIKNEQLQRYIDRIGQRIARVCHRPDWDYRYVAVEDISINAFALPGGHIFITRGLLEKLHSEAQLAAILGHETAHVVARHSAAAMSKENLLNVGILAAAVSGQVDPRAVQIADLAARFLMLSYSRQDEQEADLAGLDYMVAAGYDPQAMVETMQMLQDLDKVQPIEFFSTHPSPENRIRYLKETIAFKHLGSEGLKVGKEDYQTTVLDFLKTYPRPRARPGS